MYTGMMLMDPVCEHDSVHCAGHPDISKDDVHRLGGGEKCELASVAFAASTTT